MPRSSALAPYHWRPAFRSPVAFVAVVVAASLAFAATNLPWLGDYVAP